MADETRLDTTGSNHHKSPATRLDPRHLLRGTPHTRLDGTDTAQTRTDGPKPVRSPDPAAPTPPPEVTYRRENLPPGLSERLTMHRELGHGAEASVWLCTDSTGQELAVKLFHHPPTYETDFGTAEYREHFRPEHAVQVFERGSDHKVHYEIMEYCRFGTLEDHLTHLDGPATHQHAIDVLTELVTALDSMQQPSGGRRLVHGDIKPKNILVRTDDPLDLVLTDFGLTVDLGDRSRLTNTGQGTIAYSAPGALQFKTAPADWWSVGMVMYQVLVGRAYFQHPDRNWIQDHVIENELNTRDVSLAEVDQLQLTSDQRGRWKLLLAGLLTRAPDQRWGVTEIKAWCAGKSPAIHRPTDVSNTPADPTTGSSTTTNAAAAVPFPLPGVGEFHTAHDLGTAMSLNPDAAARALSGRGRQKLLNWLTDSARTRASYTDLNTAEDWGPEELATYFTAQLAPEAPISYRGRTIGTPADLCSLATSTDSNADDLAALYNKDLLGCLDTHRTRERYRMIDADWHDIVEQALDLARSRRIAVEPATRHHIIRNGLLAAADQALANGYIASVTDRLNRPDLALAAETAWFRDLRYEAGI